MKYKITPSLIDQAEFAISAPPSWKDQAYAGLSKSLQYIWEELDDTHPIKRGMLFEERVENDCISGADISKASDNYKKVIADCSGGIFQHKISKEHEYNGKNYFLSGKIDVYFPGEKIIDLKTTETYKSGKYLQKTQHLFYIFCTGAPVFQYIVVEWDNWPKIKGIHYENFAPKCSDLLSFVEGQLFKRAEKVIDYIYSDDYLRKNYEEIYCKYIQ